MDKSTDALRKVLHDYAVPDPKIVSKLPKGGATLDFVGHADITRILIEIDPEWQIEPAMVDMNGLPAVVVTGNMVQAGFWMTLLGQSRYCVGSVEERKADRYKELLSDGIRNGAMRFGVALHLWTKAEWEDLGATPTKPNTGNKKQETNVVRPASPDAIKKFVAVCGENNLDHDQVADHAGVNLAGIVTTEDLVKLRESFKVLKGTK
jgi:hypothetical protein